MGQTNFTQLTSNLTAGLYSFGLTLLLFCCGTLNANAQISVTTTVTNITCSGDNNGSITAQVFGGRTPYTFNWSNGDTNQTATGLSAGIYTVTVIDNDSAIGTATAQVYEPDPLTIILQSSSTCGVSGGSIQSIVFQGTPPYTYLWSDGQTTPVASGLATGTYTLTATDANGCTAVESADVNTGTNLNLFTTASFESCAGSNDGTATVVSLSGMSPFTYLWSDGQTTDVAVGLSAGIYTVTVTDSVGCQGIATQVVDISPEGIWIMLMSTDAFCDLPNGTAHVSVMTGQAPYTYLWSNGNMTADPIGLDTGTYSVTVTDAIGCSAVGSVDVGASSTPDPGTISTTDSTTFCVTDTIPDIITVTSSGTNAPEFAFVLTDANGIILDINVTGVFDLTNAPPGTCLIWGLAWAGTLTGAEIGDNANDIQGCFALTAPITVIRTDCQDPCEADAGTLTGIPTACLIPGGSVTLTATPDGNSVVPAGYETIYVLTSGNGLVIQATNTAPTFTVNTSGIFTIHTLVYDPNTLDLGIVIPGTTTGFDVNALLIQGGGTICGSLDVNGARTTINDAPDVSISPSDPVICAGGSIVLMANSSASNLMYEWTATGGSFNNPNFQSTTYTMMMPGTYTISVKVSDMNGCENTAMTTVTVEAPDAGTLTIDADPVCLQNGMANLSATPNGDAVVPAGYETIYVLTSGSGLVIQQTSATPSFVVTTTGDYTIHTLVYNPATLDLGIIIPGTTTGFDVNSLLVQGGGSICGSLDVAGAPVNVFRRLIGDFVWIDQNWDGYQNSFERGFEGATVNLVSAGPDGIFGTTDDIIEESDVTDANGAYLFECAAPGEYIVSVVINNPDYTFTTKDATLLDEGDSDVDSLTGNTEPFTITSSDGDNLTIDAGVHLICVNYTYPGTIAENQIICSGTQPALLTGTDVPSGGFGPIEYLWMYSNQDPPPPDINLYTPYPNSNSPDFQPGPIFEKTFIRRCARSAFCTDYVETDELVIDVIDCSMATVQISAKAMHNGNVELKWDVLDAKEQYNYYIERQNPKNLQFETIKTVSGAWPSGDMLSYNFIDQSPHVGRNFYRIKQVGLYRTISTDIIEVSVGLKSMKQILTYPNPSSNEVIIKPVNPVKDEAAVMKLFDITGKLLQVYQLAPNQDQHSIYVKTLQNGTYILRIQYEGSGEVRTTRILKLE